MKPREQQWILMGLLVLLCAGKTIAAGSIEIVTSRPYYDGSVQDYGLHQNFININNPLSMLVYESKKINPKSTRGANLPSNAQITDRIATMSPREATTSSRPRRKNFKESRNVHLVFPVTPTTTTTLDTTTQNYEKDMGVTRPIEPLVYATDSAKATSTKWIDEKIPYIVQKYDRVPRPFSLTSNSANTKRVPKKFSSKSSSHGSQTTASFTIPLTSRNNLEDDTGQFKKTEGRRQKQSAFHIAQAINDLDNSQGSYYPASTQEIQKTTTTDSPESTNFTSSATITSEKIDEPSDLVSTTEAFLESEEVTESNEEPYSKYDDDDEDYNTSNESSSNESDINEIVNHKKSTEDNEDPLDNDSTEIIHVISESIERPENETRKLSIGTHNETKSDNSTVSDYDQILGQNIQVEKLEQAVNGSVKGNDSLAQADQKLEVLKDEKGSHEDREGAYDEHHDENAVEEDEKSHKGYDEHERHRDTEKGHVDKQRHDREYREKERGRKKHDGESGYQAKREKGEKAEKKATFSEKGEHNKGHNTKGEHVVHKKDEFNKKTEFYEETHDDGSHDKEGAHRADYDSAKGGHSNKAGEASDEHGHKRGNEGHDEKGHRRNRAKGHGHESHESRHHRDEHEHGKKARDESAKKWHAKKAGR